MQEIDSPGVFWLPDSPEDKLSGRLTFSPTGKVRLNLVGEFAHAKFRSFDQFQIHGWIGSDPITLDGCFSNGVYRKYSGVSESRFAANRMFIGHIFKDQELNFQQVCINVSHLAEWTGRTGIHVQESTDQSNSFSISYTHPPEEISEFSRGRVSLGQSWSRKTQLSKAEIIQQPFIRIEYNELVHCDDILTDVGRVQDLLTLCIDSPADTDKVIFCRPDIHSTMLSGDSSGSPQRIEFRAPRLRYKPIEERKNLTPDSMLLTYSELGGTSSIASWLDETGAFERPLNSLMSVRNTDRIYAENRFLNVAFAAEAYHRSTQGGSYMDQAEFERLLADYERITPDEHKKWLQSRLGYGNDAPLSKRLRQLAQRSRPATRTLIDQEGRWAETISKVRNELTHLGAGPSPFTGSDLFFLSESVYSVVRVCMLNTCGISPQTWMSKRESQAIVKYGDRVRSAVHNARKSLGISSPDRNL
ncbi:HEPN domain-containing protein [Actinomadura verrucosospora]|uniref:ApeA N-terminal domain 1-containing protein n=1 Tax=Actinomadura verrucosospora TaxID=46165 RepID=UPI0031ED53A3